MINLVVRTMYTTTCVPKSWNYRCLYKAWSSC